MSLSRRHVLRSTAAVGLVGATPEFVRRAIAAETSIATRAIPSTDEKLPVIGLGTYVVLDYKDDAAKATATQNVITTMVANGASLIDTAPSYDLGPHSMTGYGHSQANVGAAAAATGARAKLFIATKVWTQDDLELKKKTLAQSLEELRMDKVDLIQFHVTMGPNMDWSLLKEFKAQGHCRYTGFTNSRVTSHADTITILKRDKPDFVQIDYSLDDRDAEDGLLPAAHDSGTAVLINVPFGHGRLFKKTAGKPLPDFAKDIGAATWAQIFLKYIVSHPAVTAVIPATNDPLHMQDNLDAGKGPLPDEALRKKIASYWDAMPD